MEIKCANNSTSSETTCFRSQNIHTWKSLIHILVISFTTKAGDLLLYGVLLYLSEKLSFLLACTRGGLHKHSIPDKQRGPFAIQNLGKGKEQVKQLTISLPLTWQTYSIPVLPLLLQSLLGSHFHPSSCTRSSNHRICLEHVKCNKLTEKQPPTG